MAELQLEQSTVQMRLLIDSSKVSWKAVLLHKENKFHLSHWLV
jgi:hypothetical protein